VRAGALPVPDEARPNQDLFPRDREYGFTHPGVLVTRMRPSRRLNPPGVTRLLCLACLLAGCGPRAVTRVASPTVPQPILSTVTPIPTATTTEVPSATPFPSATVMEPLPATAVVPPTEVAVPTALPAGLTIVPDVIGMPYRDAREVMLDRGFSLIYRDILDLERPLGSVLAQEPAAGYPWKTGGIVTLLRAFAPPAMWTGDKCYPLKIFSRSGRLLFYVTLEQDRPYKISTDFTYGRTGIYDYQMSELDSFSNDEADSLIFEPETNGEYVLALGPFEVSQGDLDSHPGGIPAGCLFVTLPEE